MLPENLAETLLETADDLAAINTVLIELPSMTLPEAARRAVMDLALSTLGQARLVLLKTAVRIRRDEAADQDNLEG